MPSKNKKKNIMRVLKIDEISGVDVPAQEGGVVAIMKRHTPDEGTVDFEKRSALTTVDREHSHLMVLNGPPDGVELNAGETDCAEGHYHAWVKTEGGPIIIGVAKDNEGYPHTHQVGVFSKAKDIKPEEGVLADLLEKNEASNDIQNTLTEGNTMPDTDKEIKVEDLQKQLKRATSVAELNDAQKAHFGTLGEAGQDEFLAKSTEQRIEVIDTITKAAADKDPVVYTTSDDIELRKSADPVLVAMAKSNDALRKTNETLSKRHEQEALEKRAETELSHLPGTVEDRAAMLKAVDGIEDEAQRATSMKMLKAQNDALTTAFTTTGHQNAPTVGSAEESLDNLAKQYQKDNTGTSFEKAYSAVLDTPEGADLYTKSLN